MNFFILTFKKFVLEIWREWQKKTYTPSYRLLEIKQDEEENYIVHIQLSLKNITFYAKPEEILSDDSLVDQFSPKDIRTLTYLGYLGINAPKYTILAKRLMGNEKITFALKKRGEKEPLIKTADQILKEQEIISSMSPNDAKVIGYTVATEIFQDEKKLKKSLTKSMNNNSVPNK